MQNRRCLILTAIQQARPQRLQQMPDVIRPLQSRAEINSQHQKPSRIRQLSEQGLVEAGGAPANAGDLSWEAMAAAASIKQNTDL